MDRRGCGGRHGRAMPSPRPHAAVSLCRRHDREQPDDRRHCGLLRWSVPQVHCRVHVRRAEPRPELRARQPPALPLSPALLVGRARQAQTHPGAILCPGQAEGAAGAAPLGLQLEPAGALRSPQHGPVEVLRAHAFAKGHEGWPGGLRLRALHHQSHDQERVLCGLGVASPEADRQHRRMVWHLYDHLAVHLCQARRGVVALRSRAADLASPSEGVAPVCEELDGRYVQSCCCQGARGALCSVVCIGVA
mmetsp:Transcript_112108/g.327957  ORF Transcript_112108/g.327957 Transcript_112108/m.327957 type:complete len:249 (-) Transcript_112108:43-789(-)